MLILKAASGVGGVALVVGKVGVWLAAKQISSYLGWY
jgi:hypothetical protein